MAKSLNVEVEGNVTKEETLRHIYGDLSKVTVTNNGDVVTIKGRIEEIFVSLGVEEGHGVKVIHKDGHEDVYLAKDSARLYQKGPDGEQVEKPLPRGARVEPIAEGEGG